MEEYSFEKVVCDDWPNEGHSEQTSARCIWPYIPFPWETKYTLAAGM